MKIAFKKGASCLFLSLLLVFLFAVPLQAQPVFPHAVYGTLTCGGVSAPAGTTVTAKFITAGDEEIICGAITTTVSGKYGAAPQGAEKLIIQGDELESGVSEIKFYISNAYGGVSGHESRRIWSRP